MFNNSEIRKSIVSLKKEKSKWDADLETAYLWRKAFLNLFLPTTTGLTMEFLHQYQRKMTPVERTQNNLLVNRLRNAGIENKNAMGLDVAVSFRNSPIKILMLRQFNDPNIFIKGASDVSAKKHLEIIASAAYFLYLDSAFKHYRLIDLKELLKTEGLTYKKEETQANRNRINFYVRNKPIKPNKLDQYSIWKNKMSLYTKHLTLEQALKRICDNHLTY